MSQDTVNRSRRRLLAGALAAPVASMLPFAPTPARAAAGSVREFELTAAPSPVRLADPPFAETRLWCYNGVTPGPLLRCRLGETLRVAVRNGLDEITSVHWHGLRIPNEMDGVAFLTQPPLEPGDRFVYELTPPDAGTFWYHAHENAAVQQGRGLHGPLIVDEPDPPRVDRDLVWVLDDWRLDKDAQITDDFDAQVDFSRSGRIGNTVTLNGRMGTVLSVRAGERLRLRLLNAANARIFQLRFQGHEPTVIALDGQPVEPHVPHGNAISLAPAQRADVIIDMSGRPGDAFGVIDTHYSQNPFQVAQVRYSNEPPLRASPLDAPVRLAPGSVPQPDLSQPLVKEVLLEGGDLSQLMQSYQKGSGRGVSQFLLNGKFWAICGVSAFRQVMPPFLSVARGRTVVFELKNRTAWPHTMHTHGHSFHVLEHGGRVPDRRTVLDTIALGPEEDARIAFVADNPGDWLFHCHMLSHAYAGMLATFKVG